MEVEARESLSVASSLCFINVALPVREVILLQKFLGFVKKVNPLHSYLPEVPTDCFIQL